MGKKHKETLTLVREAIDQIKRGDVVDGLTTLERTAYPKWNSVEHCYADLYAANKESK